MSFKRTSLGVLVTASLFSLGAPALTAGTLKPPDARQGVTVLTYAPPSLIQDSIFTAGSGDRDRPEQSMNKYLVPQESPNSGDALAPMQPTWVPSPMRDNERERERNN